MCTSEKVSKNIILLLYKKIKSKCFFFFFRMNSKLLTKPVFGLREKGKRELDAREKGQK
jgi:hypothetical protein